MPRQRLLLILVMLLGLQGIAHCAAELLEPDVLVVGGGLGGVSAALAATRNAGSVVIIEETDWLGGQLTSQGVSASDEHEWIETVGTKSFLALRQRIRDYYTLGYRLSEKGRHQKYLDPGDGWVSRLCHEPRAAVVAIDNLLTPARDSGKLKVFYRTRVSGVKATSGTVEEVTADVASSGSQAARKLVIRPKYVVEATPLGDFLEQAGIPFRVGTESQRETGELHAYPGDAVTTAVQGFTSCFFAEFHEGENHTIPKPELYDYFKAKGMYTLRDYPFTTGTTRGKDGKLKLPFFTFRRAVSKELFDDPRIPRDVALINWFGNDYHERDLISASPAERERILWESRQLSLSFLYWLQTELPRQDNKPGIGYPELMLRTDIFGTTDGMSMYPYIRESRRIKALKTVYQQDVTSESAPGARAKLQDDSIGLGYYYSIDIHTCVGWPLPLFKRIFTGRTPKPFQIPMGALIPECGGNVLAGQKNLGVTHVTNGCFRLHPTEWNIGEAAGTLAVYCLENKVTPEQVWRDPQRVREVQRRLVAQGVPIFWYTDLSCNDPGFAGAQLLATEKGWIADDSTLTFSPKQELTTESLGQLEKIGIKLNKTKDREAAAQAYEAQLR